MKATILTFENGTMEKIFDNLTIKLAKQLYMGTWRPSGIVTNVHREKGNENIEKEYFDSSNEHFTKFDGTQVK
jgi:hypothetical protein